MEWTTEMLDTAFAAALPACREPITITVIGPGDTSNVRTIHPHGELVCLFGGALVVRKPTRRARH